MVGRALKKELVKARAMTGILAAQATDMRAKAEALIKQADNLACQSWNERIDQAINGGFPWLEIECSRCKLPNSVDLCALRRPATTYIHDLAGRLRCRKCETAGKRPSATLLQLAPGPRNSPPAE
jgi:phage FluMu protein Com